MGIGVLNRGGLARRSAMGRVVSRRRRVVHLVMGRSSMMGLRVLVLVLVLIWVMMLVRERVLVRLARWADLGRRMGHGRSRRGRDWWYADVMRLVGRWARRVDVLCSSCGMRGCRRVRVCGRGSSWVPRIRRSNSVKHSPSRFLFLAAHTGYRVGVADSAIRLTAATAVAGGAWLAEVLGFSLALNLALAVS